MRVKILRKYWNIEFKALGRHKSNGEKVDGLCDPVVAKNRSIWIDSNLSGRAKLETVIHEFQHACDQCAVGFVHSEDYVEHLAADLSRILWKLGYRDIDGHHEQDE
jgi:hypothetical protein